MGNDAALLSQPMLDWSPAPATVVAVASLASSQAAGSSADAPPAPPTPLRINPTNRELRFTVPLTDGPTYLGDVELAVSPRDLLSVEAPRLLDLLAPIVKADVEQRLRGLVGGDQRLDQDELGREHIRLVYDADRLALAIDVPVDARRSRSLSFRDARGTQIETLKPARVSGYLNIRGAAQIVQAGRERGVIPPTAALDTAWRLHGIVLESEGYVSARRNEPWFRRSGSRIVYEDVSRAMRLSAGDLQVYPRPFQTGSTIGGVGIARLYSQIDPQREIHAGGAQSISIAAPSMVETIVNGRTVERRLFQPGNYRIEDFPLAEGANAVKLRIEDEGGKVRTVDFSVYANPSLLAKGITEFAATGGLYSTPTRTGIAYSHAWVGSGFVRRGLNEQLTAGINAQANAHTRQVGIELVWGGTLGLTGFTLAASNDNRAGSGVAAAMSYELLRSSAGGDRSQGLRLAVEWRSRRFVAPAPVQGPDLTELRASGGYVVTLGHDRFVALDGQLERNRDGRGLGYGARLSGGLNLSQRLAVTSEIGRLRLADRDDRYARVGLRMRLGSRGSAQAEGGSDGSFRAGASLSGGRGNGAWQTAADATGERGNATLNLTGSIQTNRAELGAQESLAWRGSRISDARLTVRAGTAIAFADGAVAIGRPVSDAFVIASTHSSLGRKPLYLDPDGKSEAARTGGLGAALDGQLGAHSFRTLNYQVPDAPAGYDLGDGNIAIEPPYRSGYRLVVGSDYNLLVIGRLVTDSGTPLALLAGKAIDLDHPKHPSITIFTSRDGRFGAQGLRPGRWRIEMPTEVPTHYSFTVTNSPNGTARIGDLRPTTAKGLAK